MRPYFGHLYSQASAYHRQISFADEMLKQGLIDDYAHNEYDPEKFNHQVNKLEQALHDLETRNKFAIFLHDMIKEENYRPFIFQSFQTTWGLAMMDYIQYLGAPVFIEIDDDMTAVNFDNDLAKPYIDPNSMHNKISKNAFEHADGMIVSTKHLRDRIKQYTYEDRILVVENGVDFSIYDNLKNNTHKTYLHIGWQGGSSHVGDLELIENVIKPIHDKYKNVRFTFVGDATSLPKKVQNLERVTIDRTWKPVDKFPEYIAKKGFDIQIAPMADNLFNRSKSNLRLIQAAALRTPTIASLTIPYKDFPALYANTEEDWVKAIETLIEDKTKRIQLGEEAYNFTKENYAMERQAKKYFRSMKRLVKKFDQRRKKNVNAI